MLKNKGFTLIEALIGVLILGLIVISITRLITGSVVSTRERIIMECLVNAANSAIEACRGGVSLSDFQCGAFNIILNIHGNCDIQPPSNIWDSNCEEILVTAIYENKEHKIRDYICKFWDGR